jgi:hypothetical protein
MASPYDLPQAQQKVTDYSTQKWGRGPQNDQEWSAVGKGINYGDGVDDHELTQAYGNVDAYANSLGAKPVQQAQAPSPQPQAQGQGQPLSPIQSAFQGGLLNLMNRAQQAPSLNDPMLSAQSQAFRTAQQRGAERSRAAMVERMGADGTLGGGGLTTGIGQIENARTLAEANFDTGLLANEQNIRRQEFMDALRLAAASGDNEAARLLQSQGLQLQERLGLGDLDLRNRGLAQQGELGRGDLSLRYMLGLMGNQQFYDQLGTNTSQWLADFNMRNFNSAMGGL